MFLFHPIAKLFCQDMFKFSFFSWLNDSGVPLCVCTQSCLTLWLVSSSVHGIFQSRILEWVAISYSRGSSWPRDWTHISFVLHWQAVSLPPGRLGVPISVLRFFLISELVVIFSCIFVSLFIWLCQASVAALGNFVVACGSSLTHLGLL